MITEIVFLPCVATDSSLDDECISNHTKKNVVNPSARQKAFTLAGWQTVSKENAKSVMVDGHKEN